MIWVRSITPVTRRKPALGEGGVGMLVNFAMATGADRCDFKKVDAISTSAMVRLKSNARAHMRLALVAPRYAVHGNLNPVGVELPLRYVLLRHRV
jgi:hypothetical protein